MELKAVVLLLFLRENCSISQSYLQFNAHSLVPTLVTHVLDTGSPRTPTASTGVGLDLQPLGESLFRSCRARTLLSARDKGKTLRAGAPTSYGPWGRGGREEQAHGWGVQECS